VQDAHLCLKERPVFGRRCEFERDKGVVLLARCADEFGVASFANHVDLLVRPLLHLAYAHHVVPVEAL
jgi:hypothetical protein